ncbi:hypothetical protein C8T65DRAFT_741043 [Cerioporus squamosus]|nr:hypothetical protein C8T65DRAFT_741040 [Cerioporus squamosus]KAI0704484.1 hypothetical protein C8T65DRAFT_741043 [Cerioporus squamosus]
MDSGDERGYDGDSDSSDASSSDGPPLHLREWLQSIADRASPPGDRRVEKSACRYFLEAIDLHTHSLDCETEKERTTQALTRVALAAIRTAYELNETGGKGLDKERLRMGMEALGCEVRAVEEMQKECLGEPCWTLSLLPLLPLSRSGTPPLSPPPLPLSPRPIKKLRTVPPVPLFDESPAAYASRATPVAGCPKVDTLSDFVVVWDCAVLICYGFFSRGNHLALHDVPLI